MILKFRSPVLGCWVYEDGICQIKTGRCKFREKMEDEGESTSIEIPDGSGLKLVPCHVGSTDLEGAPIDFDWIVDPVLAKSREAYMWIQLRYGKDAGWPTSERTFIFRNESRVFLMNDEGKTIERL